MRSTFTSAIVLLTLIALSYGQSQSTQMCDMALSNLKRETSKFLVSYSAGEFSGCFASLVGMKYILPKVIEVCEGNTNRYGESQIDFEFEPSPQACSEVMTRIKDIISIQINGETPSVSMQVLFQLEDLAARTIAECDYAILAKLDSKTQTELHNSVKGVDGSKQCLICAILVTIQINRAVYKGIEISDYIANHFCQMFPKSLQTTCIQIVEQLGPHIIEGVANKDNSDVICRKANKCGGEFSQCNLHSASYPNETLVRDMLQEIKKKSFSAQQLETMAGGSNPWQWIMDLFNRLGDQHLAVVDFDNDGFSTIPRLRGFHWRGKDCDDFSKDIYPGRKVFTEPNNSVDYDCNGISGVNTVTGKNYEDELCGDSDRIGVIVIGDSAGAHFAVPPKYFNVTMYEKGTFSDFFDRLMDEFDQPNLSAVTGLVDNNPLVNSIYQRLIELNRCNRNDYQNIGVNGARSGASEDYMAIKRNTTLDHPQLVIFELVGNDVCSGHESIESMTSPDLFRTHILSAWAFLDTVLPKGSHVVVWGLAEGTILFEALNNQEHPLFVTYNQFYDYLNCLQTSPCWGWMNTDASIRAATENRADELNKVYEELIATQKYNNFDLIYYRIPLREALDMAISEGHQPIDIIERVDGFHPSQLANYYVSEIIWQRLLVDRPEWIPRVNPNNKIIDTLFGTSQITLEQA